MILIPIFNNCILPGESFSLDLSSDFGEIIKNYNAVKPADLATIQSYSGWQQVAGQESDLNSRLPFRSEMPFVVAGLKPVLYQKQWWLQDQEGGLCKIAPAYQNIWQLMAISGGEALTMTVIGKENEYRPLGVWHQNNYKAI